MPARHILKEYICDNAESGKSAHLLFVGAKGCGKSTELNKMQEELMGEFAVLSYSVMEELDPQSLEYIELFIVTMQRLFKLAVEKGLDIDEGFLKKIENWTQTKEISEIKDKHFSAEAEAGVGAKSGVPFFLDFFAKLKSAARTSKSFKETIKETIEPRLADLINLCNELITEVRIALTGQYKDLIIIIEDLDKIPLPQAEKLFFDYPHQLTQLKAIVVYTFPVSLYYNTGFGVIRPYFKKVVELPMIKISQKDGSSYDTGREVMRSIVDARINPALFANDTILPKFIAITGGGIRDLFDMLNAAATAAGYKKSATISDEHYNYAHNQLKGAYRNTIADFLDDKGALKYPASAFYNALNALECTADKKPDNSEVMMLLRQNLCVLSYNGEGWCDVHPIMKEVLAERNANKPQS